MCGVCRKEALKEADEISALPVSLRIDALEKTLRRLLTGSKCKLPQQGNNIIRFVMLKTEMKNSLGQIKISDNVSNNTSINEEQQSQVNYALFMNSVTKLKTLF